jgi:hypothetical protein
LLGRLVDQMQIHTASQNSAGRRISPARRGCYLNDIPAPS